MKNFEYLKFNRTICFGFPLKRIFFCFILKSGFLTKKMKK